MLTIVLNALHMEADFFLLILCMEIRILGSFLTYLLFITISRIQLSLMNAENNHMVNTVILLPVSENFNTLAANVDYIPSDAEF
jgi:hypothetical protein